MAVIPEKSSSDIENETPVVKKSIIAFEMRSLTIILKKSANNVLSATAVARHDVHIMMAITPVDAVPNRCLVISGSACVAGIVCNKSL